MEPLNWRFNFIAQSRSLLHTVTMMQNNALQIYHPQLWCFQWSVKFNTYNIRHILYIITCLFEMLFHQECPLLLFGYSNWSIGELSLCSECAALYSLHVTDQKIRWRNSTQDVSTCIRYRHTVCDSALPYSDAAAAGIADSVVRMDEEEVKSIADNCNTKKLNSKRVEVSLLSRKCLY